MFTISVVQNGQKLNLTRKDIILDGQCNTLFTFTQEDSKHVVNSCLLDQILMPLYEDETVTSVIIERKMSQ